MISDTHLFQPLSDKVRQVDHHGGYTAAAGHAVYTGRTYPSQWWNRTAFVCGPTGKLVGTFVLKPDGAGFRSFSPNNLIASDDEWSAPIMAEVGPDGNVWVIDWYNYIVQHNPTPQGFETGPGNAYLTDLRDKRFGRVYRVVYQDGQSEPAPELARLSIDNVPGLLAGLSHPSMVVRLSAQRLLIERGKIDCVGDLIGLVSDTTVDKIGLNPAAIHAIHTLAGLNALDDEASDAYAAVVAALRHPSAGVRRAAVNRLTDSPVAAKALVDANVLDDSDAQVVLATLLAIADQSSPQLAGAVATFVASDRVNDRWLADASTSAAARHPAKFLGQLASLSSTKPLPAAAYRIARRVAEHFARSESSDSDTQALIQSLAKAETRLIGEVIDGLSAGWPNNRAVALNDQGADLLKQLFRAASDQSKAALVQLAVKWKSDALDPEKAEVSRILLVQVEEEGTPVEQRVSAAERLVALDPSNPMVLDRLAAGVTPLSQPPLVIGFIGAISNSTAPEAADRLIALTEAATPTIRDRAIQTLLSRPSMTQALLSAIEAGEMSISDLTALQRQTLGDHPNREIRQQAQKILASGGGNMNSDRQKLVDDKMHLTAMKGDVEAGKAIFTKNCATCHKYQGEGAVVGPDLTGMSVHPKAELLTHILDPSRSVESNYRLYTVLTADGLVISGLLAGESQTSIEMIDAQAKRHTILREDIEQLVASRKSAMPEGLEESMGDKGIVDLLEFLTAKGEYVPLPIGQVATIVSTKGMFYDAENRMERLVFRDWGPKTFKGVPFILVDPQNGNANNVILLHSNNGTFPPRMPKSVMLPCETGAKRIHLLGGVAGWGATEPRGGGVSMLVRLHYIDGKTEDHPLIDGQHIADYIRIIDVPKSELAFDLNGRQVRYLTIEPKRTDVIKFIEFVKPNNGTAPIVMAVTVQPVGGDH
jgi:putative heme-binding domain-containing protein